MLLLFRWFTANSPGVRSSCGGDTSVRGRGAQKMVSHRRHRGADTSTFELVPGFVLGVFHLADDGSLHGLSLRTGVDSALLHCAAPITVLSFDCFQYGFGILTVLGSLPGLAFVYSVDYSIVDYSSDLVCGIQAPFGCGYGFGHRLAACAQCRASLAKPALMFYLHVCHCMHAACTCLQ